MPLPRLHIVTDDRVAGAPPFLDNAARVMQACGAACALHLRAHSLHGRRLHELGEALAAAALRTGAWLLVNDRIDVAMAVRANGVQLGRRSMAPHDARTLLGAGAQIGCSVHSSAGAVRAGLDGADFALMGTIFESASHAGTAAAGVAALAAAVDEAGIPVLAIGGVTPERVEACAQAGAYGVAVLAGVWHAPDVTAAAHAYVSSLQSAWSRTT